MPWPVQASPRVPQTDIMREKVHVARMKETVIESPLIGSGSQEEAERRVQVLLDMGTSRGYLTYEELNTKLPDEVVSPDKLDSLLMMIDEMGIRLIDDTDIAEHQKTPVKIKTEKLERVGIKVERLTKGD